MTKGWIHHATCSVFLEISFPSLTPFPRLMDVCSPNISPLTTAGPSEWCHTVLLKRSGGILDSVSSFFRAGGVIFLGPETFSVTKLLFSGQRFLASSSVRWGRFSDTTPPPGGAPPVNRILARFCRNWLAMAWPWHDHGMSHEATTGCEAVAILGVL